MRLKSQDADFIKKTALDCFGNRTKVYLFGSRADDKRKGGDIDLYIETELKNEVFDNKIKMLRLLHNKLGERKIDIVINNYTSSLNIFSIARMEGILL